MVDAKDAIAEMHERFEYNKRWKWVSVGLGFVVGLVVGYFGSGFMYQITHSLNDRNGIE